MRKVIIPIIILLIIGLTAGGWILFKGRKGDDESAEEERRRLEPVNQIPIKERPFTIITPRADGREVTILVNQLEGSREVEYELEYQAGTLLQGAFGMIDFSKENPPVERNLLLGSCSAGGKCSYHEDVNGGTITLRYTNGEVTKLKAEWNFQIMREQEGIFTARDAKFTFDVGKKGLQANTFVIVSQTMGLPDELVGEIVGGPYNISLPKNTYLRSNKASIFMRLTEAGEGVKLFGWTEKGWKEYEAEVSGKELEASVDLATTYVAVATSTDSE